LPIFRLTTDLLFPPVNLAEDGLLAVGGDLSPERLLLAYKNGIFPWYEDDSPILWWSPEPRLVLYPGEFHLSKRSQRYIRRSAYTITFDQSFNEVIQNCARIYRKEEHGTWITSDMERAYIHLHEMGYAHSIECWQNNILTGGLYGISLGACFFGESMFSLKPNASKAALAALVQYTLQHQFHFIDCQVSTDHLLSMGAVEIPRKVFMEQLKHATQHETRLGSWQS